MPRIAIIIAPKLLKIVENARISAVANKIASAINIANPPFYIFLFTYNYTLIYIKFQITNSPKNHSLIYGIDHRILSITKTIRIVIAKAK